MTPNLNKEEIRAHIRDRLMKNEGVQPTSKRGDLLLNPTWRLPANRTPAAVMLLLVPRAAPQNPTNIELVFTVRTPTLSAHAGQVSLPGGRIDAQEEYITAACRETTEEIGIDSTNIDILGRLPAYPTRTGYTIEPVVGWWTAPPPAFRVNSAEVADVFVRSLDSFLAFNEHLMIKHWHVDGGKRQYFEWQGEPRIWGITAGILASFVDVISDGALYASLSYLTPQ